MSKSRRSPNSIFYLIAGGTVAAAAVVVLLWWSQLQHYRHIKASDYARLAKSDSSVTHAIEYYRLALALDPDNAGYRNSLADLYLKDGKVDQAIDSLKDTDGERLRKARLEMLLGRFEDALSNVQPVSGSQANVLRSQIYLEQGIGERAITAVSAGESRDEKVQLALSYQVTGNSNAAQAIAQANPNDKTLQSLRYRGLTLAQQLFARGLYRSCLRTLSGVGERSTAKFSLQSQAIARELPQTNANLAEAKGFAELGLKVEPSNLDLRRQLRDLELKLGDSAGAAQQQALITRLEAGGL